MTLVSLLESSDFYTKLYTLQLLAAIILNRPDKAQDKIVSTPLGISSLVAILDDRREAIRNGKHTENN